MSNSSPVTLQQLFRFWRPGLPHQAAAVVELEEDLKANGYATAMRRDRPWINTWSQDGKQSDSIKLNVPWFNQNNNLSGMGYRECFSSSAAMVASFWGERVSSDDAYNQIRSKFGDSTDPQAQLQALRSLGLVANFRTDGTPELLRQELNAGRPVAVGWLHKGTARAPRGGGHWSVAIGHGSGFWIMNDPNGEADLVNGGYTANHNGANLKYSTLNWNPRWMVNGTGGWMLTCRKL